MRFLIAFTLLTFLQLSESQGGRFSTSFSWRSLAFSSLPSGAAFNFTHPVPFGIAHHRNRMFIGTPRRNVGVPVTLSFINLNDQNPEPLLHPYPNYQTNSLHPQNSPDPSRIVNIYRPRVDECDRLWFVDTGVLEFPNNRIIVQRPSIWVINLKTDTLINRFEIPASVVENGRGLVSLTIDDPHGTCQGTFAYLTDWFTSRMIVYSSSQNRAWSVDHNYFHSDPLLGDFNVNGLQFTRRDGLFSIALSHRLRDTYKLAFFHPMCTDAEFVVSTHVLQNETLATRTFHGRDFKLLGRRGDNKAQAGIHLYDVNTRVMFITQLQRNAVDCWRFDNEFTQKFMDTVEQNDETLYYPVDMIIDKDSTVWVLTNKMPRVIYSQLNFSESNFYLLRANAKDLMRGKKCNVRDGIDNDEWSLRVFADDK